MKSLDQNGSVPCSPACACQSAQPAETAESSPRRDFFAGMAGALAAAALLSSSANAEESPAPKKLPKWGMVIDLDKCTNCQGCAAACRIENNVPVHGPDPEGAPRDRGIFWMDVLKKTEGVYPDLREHFMPMPCNHCEDPTCVKVCPVGATFVDEEGLVAQIWARCIGCRYCTVACHYSRRHFNWEHPHFPEDMKNQLNPDVATRPKGVVEKCTFCVHRIRAMKEKARFEGRAWTDEDVRQLPACAQTCPAEAIVFGDLNDPESEVSRLSKSPRAFKELEELGTRPKVIYLREAKWNE
jgi:molybdopterin-containing oxidoreductase family iron-sulfur binding subunit